MIGPAGRRTVVHAVLQRKIRSAIDEQPNDVEVGRFPECSKVKRRKHVRVAFEAASGVHVGPESQQAIDEVQRAQFASQDD